MGKIYSSYGGVRYPNSSTLDLRNSKYFSLGGLRLDNSEFKLKGKVGHIVIKNAILKNSIIDLSELEYTEITITDCYFDHSDIIDSKPKDLKMKNTVVVLDDTGKQLKFYFDTDTELFGKLHQIEKQCYYIDEDDRKYKVHNSLGPAISCADGKLRWFIDGRLHREGLPAIVGPDDVEEWYVAGFPHRTDGPYCSYSGGSKYYAIAGNYMTEWEFEEFNLKYDVIVNEFGFTVCNRETNMVDCEYFPAQKDKHGNTWKYRNGKLHTESGPAVEYIDGRKEWYVDGKRHRLYGPAVSGDGTEEYWVNDKEYSKENYLKQYPIAKAILHTDKPIELPSQEDTWVLPGLAILAAGIVAAISVKPASIQASKAKKETIESRKVIK